MQSRYVYSLCSVYISNLVNIKNLIALMKVIKFGINFTFIMLNSAKYEVYKCQEENIYTP